MELTWGEILPNILDINYVFTTDHDITYTGVNSLYLSFYLYAQKKKDMPTSQQRRKHQISYLAFQVSCLNTTWEYSNQLELVMNTVNQSYNKPFKCLISKKHALERLRRSTNGEIEIFGPLKKNNSKCTVRSFILGVKKL